MNRKIITILIASAICMGMVAGCQPTPEQSIVNQKQEIVVEAAETDNKQLESIPTTLERETKQLSDELSVTIDAQVFLPENTPVATLTKEEITQEQQINWIKTLTEGEVYFPREVEEYSKSELEELLLAVKSGMYSDLYKKDPEAYYAENKEYIEYLEQLYANATEKGTIRYFDFENPTFPCTLEWSGHTKKNGQIDIGYTNMQLNLQYINSDSKSPMGNAVTSIDDDPHGGVSISVDEAKEIADQFVQSLGLEGFTIDAQGLIPNFDLETAPEVSSYEEFPKCYCFYYTRNIGGMNETYVDRSYLNLYANYSELWRPETICVLVDDEGVPYANYESSPCSVEIVEENAKILDFDEILEKFYDQIKVSGCWVNDFEDIVKRDVYIDEIRLGGMRIVKKDSSDYLYIPVWSFFGSIVETRDENSADKTQLDENNQFTQREFRQCLLTVNALDGTIIDRAQGY